MYPIIFDPRTKQYIFDKTDTDDLSDKPRRQAPSRERDRESRDEYRGFGSRKTRRQQQRKRKQQQRKSRRQKHRRS
jgi:hypothetical protein